MRIDQLGSKREVQERCRTWVGRKRGRESSKIGKAYSRSRGPSEIGLKVCSRSSLVCSVLDLAVVGVLSHLQTNGADGWGGGRGSVVTSVRVDCAGMNMKDQYSV
jgi:hypothetical protein